MKKILNSISRCSSVVFPYSRLIWHHSAGFGRQIMKISLIGALLLDVGCGVPEEESRTREAWDKWNDPTILEEFGIGGMSKFKTRLTELPEKSSIDLDFVWSGDYWPSYLGGISQRWNYEGWERENIAGYKILSKKEVLEGDEALISGLSPAEKYDILSGDYSFALTRHERARTGIMKTFESSEHYEEGYVIPEWEGLCHGWAPATIAFEEPKPIEYESDQGVKVKLYSSDIKALLTFLYHYQSPNSTILGKRCNEDPPEDMDALYYKVERGEVDLRDYQESLRKEYVTGKISFGEYRRSLAEARSVESCMDSNAGAFHIVLTNQIGRMQQGFVMDVTREAEVWNQGVVGYEAVQVARFESGDLSPGVAAGTVAEVQYKTTVFYISEVSTHKSPADYLKSSAIVPIEYEYKLELDGDGQVLGGSWVSYDRPDFLWKQDKPKFKGYFELLGKIYKASTRG